jgi:Tfp pilus assembly major pilin PilA
MIVVAIIGILAAIAIPAYQDYVIRSQVSEGLAMASATKASVAEFFADRGEWPADECRLGITRRPPASTSPVLPSTKARSPSGPRPTTRSHFAPQRPITWI